MTVLLTIGEMAKRLDVTIAALRYIISARGIKPVARAAEAYIYSEDSFRAIQDELERPGRGRGRRRLEAAAY